MRILIVNSFYFPDQVGGAERSIKILADELVRKGHSVGVFATGSVDNLQEEIIDGVTVYRVPSDNFSISIPSGFARLRKPVFHLHNCHTSGAAQRFAAVCESFRPDVIHSNNLAWISVSIWGVAKRMGIPVVHTLRDYALLCANYGFFRGGKPCGADRCLSCVLLSKNKISASASVHTVVGNSRFTLERHLALGAFPNSRKVVIYNGFRGPEKIAARKHPLRGGGNIFVFGAIGTLSAHKGTDLLIRSFQVTQARHPGLKLRLVLAGRGDPSYESHLRSLAGTSEIDFMGTVPQAEFFGRIDACVVPSLWEEPLSRVLFESFAYAVPVVASNSGGTSELVKPNDTGWIFSPNEPHLLADRLSEALTDLDSYERISFRSLERSTGFVPERVFSEYLAVFDSAANKETI